MRRVAWYTPCTWANDARALHGATSLLWEEGSARRHALVRRPAARRDAAAARAGRRRQRRRVVLQPRAAARALQHGGHAQGAAHRAPDHRLRVLLGHGTHPVLHRRRHLWLARSAVRPHRCAHRSPRATAPRASRNSATNATSAAARPCWWSSASTAWASATWSPTSISSARWWWTTAARCSSRAGTAAPGQYVDLRFEMDTLVLLHAGPHPLAAGAHLRAGRRALAGASRRAAGRGRWLPHALPGECARLHQHRKASTSA